MLFAYLARHHALDPRRASVEDLSPQILRSFLAHLENERGNSVATRNQRLAALHSLFGFIGRQVPELVEQATQVHAIPLRKTITPTMVYLEKDEIDGLLEAPDRHRLQGVRDYALILFLYNTGARASEVATVTVGDLDLNEHPSDIYTIRAWLGHVALETTNRYAQIDLETKAAALKSCAIQDDTSQEYSTPLWHRNNNIMAFLKTL